MFPKLSSAFSDTVRQSIIFAFLSVSFCRHKNRITTREKGKKAKCENKLRDFAKPRRNCRRKLPIAICHASHSASSRAVGNKSQEGNLYTMPIVFTITSKAAAAAAAEPVKSILDHSGSSKLS